ncbi:Serine/threonine-protein kinase 11-interacting protein [Armadillidium vulgare]|nr:Serine/threonine-protein kinase 11-interacting protein [Armadillidium vulgare]
MPALSENASNVLQSLNLSNNLIVDLRGIERFITLEELNLKGNLISVEQTLVHLNDLANLKNLNILRNPVTHGLNYRNHVLRCLHSSIRSCEQFILDDTTLLFSERKIIGATSGRLKLGSSSSQLLKCLIDSINNTLKGKKTNCNRSREPTVVQLAQPSSSFNLHKSSIETEREESSSPDNTTTNKLPPRGSGKKRSRKNAIRTVSRMSEQPEVPLDDSPISLEGSLTKTSLTLKNKDISSASKDFFNEQRKNLNFPPSHLELEDDLDLCTLTKAPSPSDKLLEEILNSHSQNLLNKSFSSLNQSVLEPPDKSLNSTSFHDCPSAVSSSNSSIYKLNDSFNLDVSPVTTDDEELEPQRELYSVIAKWENKVMDKNVEVDSDFVFLSFTQHFYKEKNGLSKGTMVKLNISSLQSMEVLSMNPIKVQLNFNYPQPELNCRRFIFEEEDFKLLKDLIEPIIEQNKKDNSKPPLPCSLCKLPFYGIIAQPSGTKRQKKFCKRCGNKKRKFNSLYESQDSENIPEENLFNIRNINSHDKESYPQEKQSESTIPEGKSRNEKGTMSSDSSESVSICSSNGTSTGNQKHDNGSTPSLSSIEVLQENVAPDGEEKRYYEKGIPVFELPVTAESNVDFRTPPDKDNLKVLRLIDTNGTMKSSLLTDPAVMQESSSSGSMSGSVCTTVDRLSSGPSTPHRHDGGEQRLKGEFSDYDLLTSERVIKNPDEQLNFSSSIKSTDTVCHRPHFKSSTKTLKEVFDMHPQFDHDRKGIVLGDACNSLSLKKWEKDIVGCYTSYSRESLMNTSEEESVSDSYRISDIPIFSYDDFTAVDHRLKLYCEVFLFTEHQEVLQGLFKAVVSTEDETPFLGVLAISNRKIYILRITSEENDSPQEWLEVNVICYLEEVPSLYTVLHKQGVVVKFGERMVLLCLADSQRANAALYFILNCLDRFGYHPAVDDKFCRAQSENLRRQVELLNMNNSESRDNVVHLFQSVTLLHDNGECSNHFLVLTSVYIILFEADLSWLSASRFKCSSLTESIEEPTVNLPLTYCYHLNDVIQVGLKECFLILIFENKK